VIVGLFSINQNILCVHLSLAELGEKLAEDLQVSIRDVQVPLQLLRLHKKKIFKTNKNLKANTLLLKKSK
jgi:hypothetical protein